jgi:DNA-binding NarL/FixJ family response regulator
MSVKTASRAPGGAVAIAGVDAPYCRRLLQSLRSGNGSRSISTLAGLAIVSALSGLAKTIVLAGTDDDALAVKALKAGAAGFCARDTSTDLLRRAVQLVEAGEIWVGRRVMVRLIEELALRTAAMPAVTGGEQLTPRERELVGFVAGGATNKDIARRLSISVSTVKTHLTSIFGKLGLSTRLELAVAIGRAAAPRTKVG